MKQIFLATFIVVCFCSVGSAESPSLYERVEEYLESRGIEWEKGVHQPPRIGITRIYVLVNTDNAPIEILSFGKGHTESRGSFSGEVQYKNRTDRDIEALAITMVCYDVFNDEQGFDRGVEVFPTPLKAGEEDSICLAVAGESSIVKTVMAFVSAVRFLDGEVWKVDTKKFTEIAGNMPELSFLSALEMLQIEKK